MMGTRIQPRDDGTLHLAEGQYGKAPNGVWFARPPGNHMGSLEGHTVTEHEDGTISVTPSILIDDGRNQWHGFLTKGEFIPC